MVKRLMTLPLIDHKNIPHVFERLKLRYKDQINDSPGVKKLFEYVERQWINGTRTGFVPKDYTNYKQKIRTTNIAECWNGKTFQAGGRKKHDIYQLTVLLARNAKSVRIISAIFLPVIINGLLRYRRTNVSRKHMHTMNNKNEIK